MKIYWTLVKQVASVWSNDHVPGMGAALAYYTLFSLAPLLLIVTSVAGFVFGEHAARGEIQAQLGALVGEHGAGVVEELLISVDRPAEGAWAAALGVVLLLVGATTVFGELQYALDRIWRVPAQASSGGLLGLVRERLLSFGMILAIGFLLMVSLVVSATLAMLEQWWKPMVGEWIAVAEIVSTAGSFLLGATLFALIYKVMPRARVDWKDVWVGALFTSLLLTLGQWVIGLYLGSGGIASGFGAAGSLVVGLVWIYYSAQIFLIGAAFTWVYANALGSRRDLGAGAPVPP